MGTHKLHDGEFACEKCLIKVLEPGKPFRNLSVLKIAKGKDASYKCPFLGCDRPITLS